MKKLTLISPVDGSVLVERPVDGRADIEARLKAARIAQKEWAKRPIAERSEIVSHCIDALIGMNDDVVPELARMMGRPVRYGGETGGVRERTAYMAEIAERGLAPIVAEDSDAFHRYIAKEPAGIVLIIAPWNYPYLTAVNGIVPSLIAGNAVMLKHATQTLLAGERFEKAFQRGGLPDGLFHNVRLDHDTTAELIAKRSFGFVNFTGSVGGGRAIARAAAESFTGVGLELGGKDPGYVRADADLDKAVETLVDGAMYNSGQCCCGIERIYVHDSLYDRFVEKAKKLVEGYKLGDPLDPETTLGPMANIRFANEVRAQIAEALADGATALIDPKLFPRDNGSDAYLAPQILVDVDHSMRVMRDESFGPVVGIMPVSSDEQAIELMNDSPFGLTVSLWTADERAAQDIGRQVETGTVFMNRCDYLDPALCWTGCKDTGRGVSLSILGFDSVTRPKSYHLRKG